jgi:hypothetical protein
MFAFSEPMHYLQASIRHVEEERHLSRAVAQAVSLWRTTGRPGLEPGSGHMEFVVDKVELSEVFSEYFCFLCQSFHLLLNTHHNPLSGAGTIGQIVAEVSPNPKKLKKNKFFSKLCTTR